MGKKYFKMTADEILKDLEEGDVKNERCCLEEYRSCDVAQLFVAIAYLIEKNKPKDDKDNFRKKAYLTFLDGNKDKFTKAWEYIDYLIGGKKDVPDQMKIRILKGGPYKIGGYYLENYKLQEIRGASVLLTHVEETVIPGFISDRFIRECIIYSGGGNIFAILPEDCDDKLIIEMERKAQEILISANVAYYLSEPIPLKEILNDKYITRIGKVERELSERKKMKLFVPVKPELRGDEIINLESGEKIKIDIKKKLNTEDTEKKLCTSCGRRQALYEGSSEESEKLYLCASCFCKRQVGKETKILKYHNLYELHTGCKVAKKLETLSDINDEHIAVVYGDGNNMGGVIQQFNKITQMMEFSRNVKRITEEAVFKAMLECNIDKFEVVGLGGDDIFVILPGKKAIKYSVKLIDLYNKEFEKYLSTDSSQKSTLSVGVAIGKTSMPIQILLETAEGLLKDAKQLSKQQENDNGSLSYVIMDSFVNDGAFKEKNGIKNTLLPYTYDVACKVLRYANKIKGNNRTKIRNILNAFENAESIEEANLFLEYLNAKRKKDEQKIELDCIEPYEVCGGYYKKDNQYYYIWRDILDLLKFAK